MDYTELLFAAQVRDLAVQLRHREAQDYFDQPEIVDKTKASEEEAAKLHSEWYAEHRLSAYIPKAYRMIRDTADQIRALGES